jgi:benzoyl-CoA 2,3-dioxygenase component B
MREGRSDDVRTLGGISLDIIQKYINFWYTYSLDLFGGEISSNAADFFAAGLKGRFQEQKKYEDHLATDGIVTIEVVDSGRVTGRDVPLRNALNEVLRGEYVKDSERALTRWNKFIADEGVDARLYLPSTRFHRHIGEYAGHSFDIHGNMITKAELEQRRSQWLPTKEDREYVLGLMCPVTERGKIANWIAPPDRGINGNSFDFEYVRL